MAGSIKSIKLVNFMCHSSFDIQFGPNINFVIGPNGSGKSALLTALTVALGGRATVTNRAKKMDEFIKYGERTAKIIIVLHNYEKIMDKPRAFKPDDYGKCITVERTIVKDGTSKLALRNERKGLVSERKAELDEMLDHFNILINNPICILNQEVSKTFLHSKRPEDKFDLFMKATTIEQIESDYNESHRNFQNWKNTNERQNIRYALLDNEFKNCAEKVTFLERRAKLDEEVARLRVSLMWAMVRDNEEVVDTLTQKVKTASSQIIELNKDIDTKEVKITNLKEDIDANQTKHSHVSSKIKDAEAKKKEHRDHEYNLKDMKANKEAQLASLYRKQQDYMQQKKDLEDKINQLKQQARDKDSILHEREKLKLEIETLEKAIPNLEAREKSIRHHSEQLRHSMGQLRNDLAEAQSLKHQKETEETRLKSTINRLLSSKDDSIKAFGEGMKEVLKEISTTNGFLKKPIGPLGFYLKVKNQDVAGALEACLGPVCMAFVCDNYKDMSLLNRIFKRWASKLHNFRSPPIVTRRFTSRHDVYKFKSVHPDFLTLLDHIDVENDYVFNAIVDKSALESVLFIPNYEDAESVMMNAKAIPPHTSKAYTKDGSVMHPITGRGGYRSYSMDRRKYNIFDKNIDSQINEAEKELRRKEDEVRIASNNQKKIQENYSIQKTELENNERELQKILSSIRTKKDALLDYKMEVARGEQPVEITVFEEELTNLTEKIEKGKNTIQELKDSLTRLSIDINDAIRNHEESRKLFDLHQSERKEILKIIEKSEDNVKFAEHIIADATKKITAKEILKRTLETGLKETIKMLQETKSAITSGRPDEIPLTEDVRAELNTAEIHLKCDCDNMQDPEQMIESLRRRMIEIKESKDLRQFNLENAEQMEQLLEKRTWGLKTLRQITFTKVCTSFSTVMRSMNMTGMLDICLDDVIEDGQVVKKARTLDIHVETHNTPSQQVPNPMSDSNNNQRLSSTQPTTQAPRPKRRRLDQPEGNGKENAFKLSDTRSLSGGERSFSTVAFVLALWHHCVSPFKLMDEIDVFMDMVTRRHSYNALFSFANANQHTGQFIFFSPLEAPKISHPDNVKIFEMPEIVRKGDA